MKVLPFILFCVHVHYVLCEKSPLSPKKIKQILLSRRLMTPKHIEIKTKKPHPDKSYTVFPPMGASELAFSVPDSPYFPLDLAQEQKTRVKKVLPKSMQEVVRRKRSAETKPVEVKEVKTTKAVAKVEDSKTSNKTDTRKSLKSKRINGNKNNGPKLRSRKGKRRESPKLKYTKRAGKRSGSNKNRVRRRHVKKGVDGKRLRKDSRRLIAAKDAMIEDYPYVVSIQKNRQHWCAGSLLNPTLIITTANCLWKSGRSSRLRVRAGSRHTDYGGQQARIQEIMKHPSWSIRGGPDNDVALALLDRKIKFSDSVHGVDLPNRIMLPAFEDAWVTSWGADRRDGVYDKPDMSLQVYHARLMDRSKCNNVTQRFGVTVSENFICLTQLGRRAPCTRDTGAPAVSDGVLWGMASWGIRKLCGTERFPAMFSYLASQTNMDFILNATRVLMADERLYPFPDRFPYRAMRTTGQIRPEMAYR